MQLTVARAGTGRNRHRNVAESPALRETERRLKWTAPNVAVSPTALQGQIATHQVPFVPFAPVTSKSGPVFEVVEPSTTKRPVPWNMPRMLEVADRRATQMIKILKSANYFGPVMESEAAIRAFLRETIPHTYRVRMLVECMGGDAGTHDLLEPVRLELARERMEMLKKKGENTGWLEHMIDQAQRRGDTHLDVGKLSPHVAAGLARLPMDETGRTAMFDWVARELHRLSRHHQGGPGMELEIIADILDSLVSARTYKDGMSYEAAEELLLADIEAGRVALPNTPEIRMLIKEVIAMHKKLSKEVWV